MEEDIQSEDPGLLSTFYADNTEFDGSARKSVQILKLLTERVPDQGYFPEPSMSIFIVDSPDHEEV